VDSLLLPVPGGSHSVPQRRAGAELVAVSAVRSLQVAARPLQSPPGAGAGGCASPIVSWYRNWWVAWLSGPYLLSRFIFGIESVKSILIHAVIHYFLLWKWVYKHFFLFNEPHPSQIIFYLWAGLTFVKCFWTNPVHFTYMNCQ
jgi:hypothetical protein